MVEAQGGLRAMKQESWRGEYARMISLMVGADPLISREEVAERLAVGLDWLDWALGANWRERARAKHSRPE